MSRSYYEESRRELINRIMYLKNGNYVDFFRDSDSFILAMCIAYFGLTEDMMVKHDVKNGNIKTRLSTCIDKKYLKQLLDGDTGIVVRDREVDGTEPEWFLSALRNGIFHIGPDVDYDEKTVTVNNDADMNKLDCTVPFNWFKNYALDDLMLKVTVDEYNYSVFFNPFKKADECSQIKNNDDVVEFIEKELIGYTLKFKKNDLHPNKDSVERYDLINFCGHMTYIFWKYLFDQESLEEAESVILNSYKGLIETRLSSKKDEMDEESYNRLLCNTLFMEWFERAFKSKFPNYDVSIDKFDRENPVFNLALYGIEKPEDSISGKSRVDRRLFNTSNKRNVFYNYTHPAFQRMDITNQLSNLVNYDEIDYVNAIQYLYSMYMMHKDFVVDDYNLTGFMRKILKSNRVPNHLEIEEEYARSIDTEMKKRGLELSYDRQIANDLIRQRNTSNSDIHIRCREICSGYEDYYSDECLLDVMGLKSEFSDYFKEETLRREERGDYSDQVIDAYDERNLYRLCNAKGVLIQQRDEMLVALLYVLGINTFVVNMDSKYKTKLKDADYSFMDGLKFDGYSTKAAVSDATIDSQINNIQKEVDKYEGKIAGIQKKIDKCTGEEKEEKENIQEGWKEKLKEEKAKLASKKAEKVPRTITKITGSDKLFGTVTNSECATIIRNSFAHTGRIYVESKEAGGEVNLVLTDYDTNGNLSGVVRTNVSSLIKFFSHPVFERVIASTAVHSGKKSK